MKPESKEQASLRDRKTFEHLLVDQEAMAAIKTLRDFGYDSWDVARMWPRIEEDEVDRERT
jgi:hypothetical protein